MQIGMKEEKGQAANSNTENIPMENLEETARKLQKELCEYLEKESWKYEDPTDDDNDFEIDGMDELGLRLFLDEMTEKFDKVQIQCDIYDDIQKEMHAILLKAGATGALIKNGKLIKFDDKTYENLAKHLAKHAFETVALLEQLQPDELDILKRILLDSVEDAHKNEDSLMEEFRQMVANVMARTREKQLKEGK